MKKENWCIHDLWFLNFYGLVVSMIFFIYHGKGKICSHCEHRIFEFQNYQHIFWIGDTITSHKKHFSIFNYYFHALVCYHDFQIPWTKIFMLSMLACTFTSWIIHEIMVSLLPWKIWFLWNTERAWKGGERGEGKVVLQKYLKFCLFLAPFAPYKFMLLLLPWFFYLLPLTWERDNVKWGKL